MSVHAFGAARHRNARNNRSGRLGTSAANLDDAMSTAGNTSSAMPNSAMTSGACASGNIAASTPPSAWITTK
jgi:hypothetical protein